MYARSCDAFVQATYPLNSRRALSAWTLRTPSVSLLALTAFEWTPRRSKSSVTGRHKGRPIVLGFRKPLQAVYRLVLRYHRLTDSAYTQERPMSLVSAM